MNTAPGPPGGSAKVYVDWPRSSPVCLKKSYSRCSNKFVDELVGLKLGLGFLKEMDLEDMGQVKARFFFTDCQPAITSVNNVELVLGIKKILWAVQKKNINIAVHWCPGHMYIDGNELTDRFAKEAAKEAIKMTDDLSILTKKEASAEMKKTFVKMWQRTYSLSESAGKIQDIVSEEKEGQSSSAGEEKERAFRILNHLLCEHTLLNDYKAKLNNNQSSPCDNCQVPETTEHFYLFHCERFVGPKEALKSEVLRIAACEDLRCGDMDLKIMTGNEEKLSKEGEAEMVNALLQYIKNTHRFFI